MSSCWPQPRAQKKNKKHKTDTINMWENSQRFVCDVKKTPFLGNAIPNKKGYFFFWNKFLPFGTFSHPKKGGNISFFGRNVSHRTTQKVQKGKVVENFCFFEKNGWWIFNRNQTRWSFVLSSSWFTFSFWLPSWLSFLLCLEARQLAASSGRKSQIQDAKVANENIIWKMPSAPQKKEIFKFQKKKKAKKEKRLFPFCRFFCCFVCLSTCSHFLPTHLSILVSKPCFCSSVQSVESLDLKRGWYGMMDQSEREL